jgi:hypothetical protein
MVVAPSISKTVAMMHADFNVSTPEPTLEPKLFATSFEPIPNDKNNAVTKPLTRIHTGYPYSDENIFNYSTSHF